jgi:hypothetical protein
MFKQSKKYSLAAIAVSGALTAGGLGVLGSEVPEILAARDRATARVIVLAPAAPEEGAARIGPKD